MIMRIEDFFNPPLILTSEDEISVGELRNSLDCPDWVEKCLEKLADTKKVFSKEKGANGHFLCKKAN